MVERVAQSYEEIFEHLKCQLDFIKKSSADFDKGDIAEARRIASAIRILLHDSGNSNSLLKQLSLKNLLFLDTAFTFTPENLLSYHGLVSLRFKSIAGISEVSYEPLLDSYKQISINNASSMKNFDLWWEQVVIKDAKNNKFSRKELILNVANTDGGAHVDPKIKNDYANLTRHNSINWFFDVEYENCSRRSFDIGNIVFPSIRQIAFELEQSLKGKI